MRARTIGRPRPVAGSRGRLRPSRPGARRDMSLPRPPRRPPSSTGAWCRPYGSRISWPGAPPASGPHALSRARRSGWPAPSR
jgi:hypothetical protein